MAHGKKKKHELHDEHPDERWLLTYADMITLLVALFIVLWSMSSVNNAKLEILKTSMGAAFNGAVITGGEASFANAAAANDRTTAPVAPSIATVQEQEAASDEEMSKKQAEDEELEKLKQEIDREARAKGLEEQVVTQVTARGLRIRLLTDRILFDSGQAVMKPRGAALIDAMATVLKTAPDRPIQVDGHTDSVPLSGGPHGDNWGLSSARASAVVRRLIGDGFNPRRLAAGGLADNKPVASNDTDAGRAQNRRVELLLARKDPR